MRFRISQLISFCANEFNVAAFFLFKFNLVNSHIDLQSIENARMRHAREHLNEQEYPFLIIIKSIYVFNTAN